MVTDTARMHMSKQYYVYTLADPSGAVFYVGKGTKMKWNRPRVDHHEVEAQSGKVGEKCDVIRRVWASGGQVQKSIVYETDAEGDALLYEWALINLVYGRENLTNKNDGGKAARRGGGARACVRLGSLIVSARCTVAMPTLKQLRLQAHLSIAELSRLANVDRKTVERAEGGQAVQDVKAYTIVETLARQLGREISIADVDGLNIL